MTVGLGGRLAAAQQLPPQFYALESERRPVMQAGSVPPQPGVGWPIVGGLLAGTAGFFAGALVAGSIVEDSCDNEDLSCLLSGIAYGAVAGEVVTAPVGMHLGNRRRGNLPLGLAASAGFGAVGLASAAAVDDPWPLVPAAVAQMVVGVLLERKTARP
jgi:hypothetical protein